jgi:hypothetical protein
VDAEKDADLVAGVLATDDVGDYAVAVAADDWALEQRDLVIPVGIQDYMSVSAAWSSHTIEHDWHATPETGAECLLNEASLAVKIRYSVSLDSRSSDASGWYS